jgi:hypothetical protein
MTSRLDAATAAQDSFVQTSVMGAGPVLMGSVENWDRVVVVISVSLDQLVRVGQGGLMGRA